MTAKVHSRSSSKPRKARVLSLIPTIDIPLTTNCMDVKVKLKRAFDNARVGATAGAVIIELDHQGNWSVDIAGELMDDDDTLFLIAGRVFGACLVSK